MKVFKILLGTAAALMLVALIAPQAAAQCVPAQSFSNEGGVPEAQEVFIGVRAACDQAGAQIAEDAGNQIARFWSFQDSNSFNNFGANECEAVACANAAACAGLGYAWQSTMMGGSRQITGAFNSAGCCVGPTSCGGAGVCPGGAVEVAFLVEDFGPTAADGAVFWYSRIDQFNSLNAIPWDLGRVGNSDNTCQEMVSYPALDISSSSRQAGNVVATQTFYASIKPVGAFHTALGAGNTDSPESASIVSYDICLHQGSADPGRERASYNLGCSDTVPMADGGIDAGSSVPINVNCDAADAVGEDIYAAVGLTFRGGARQVPSDLVGAVTVLECDPTHVDSKPTLQRRENNIRSKRTRPSRSSGR